MSPGKPGAGILTTTGGACMMDVTGSGHMDLVLMQSGRAGHSRAASIAATAALRNSDAAAAGLEGQRPWVACAVGDYDGDG